VLTYIESASSNTHHPIDSDERECAGYANRGLQREEVAIRCHAPRTARADMPTVSTNMYCQRAAYVSVAGCLTRESVTFAW
jgi:hypothetical protein